MFKHETLNGRVAVVTGGGGVLCSGFAKALAGYELPAGMFACGSVLAAFSPIFPLLLAGVQDA